MAFTGASADECDFNFIGQKVRGYFFNPIKVKRSILFEGGVSCSNQAV